MSEKRDAYMEQILRLSTLQGFPSFPEGIKELRTQLRGVAPQPDFARQVIDRAMAERQFSPTPHDLQAIAQALRQEADAVPTGCEICEGRPWITIERTVIDSYTGQPMLRSGSKRCNCAKGRWFQEKDRERKAKATV